MTRMIRKGAPALALAALLGACGAGEPASGGRPAGLAQVLSCWERALLHGTVILRPNRFEVSCGEIGESEPAEASVEEPSRPTRVVSR